MSTVFSRSTATSSTISAFRLSMNHLHTQEPIMPAPAILRTTACRLATPARVAVRYNATLASAPPASTSALFMSGPAAPKVQSDTKVVKYAGKKKPITPVSTLGNLRSAIH